MWESLMRNIQSVSIWNSILFRSLVVVLILIIPVLSANEPLPQNLRFKHLMTESKGSVGEVLAIYQDKLGFMWVGGKNGLARYDGKEFLLYQNDPSNPNSISSNTVNDIIDDKQGNLWIATINGLNCFDFKKEQFTHYFHNPKDSNSLSSNTIYHIRNGLNDTFWLATREGLNAIATKTNKIIRYPRNDSEKDLYTAYTMDIAYDNKGMHYIATGYGLKVWNSNTGEIIFHKPDKTKPRKLPVGLIRSILVDTKQRVWVGSEKGLFQYQPNSQEFIFQPTSLDHPAAKSGAAIWDVVEDKEGRIWIATDGQGLAYQDFNTGKFIASTHDPKDRQSLSSTVVRRIFEDNTGDIWIGNFPMSINRFERYTAVFQTYRNSSNDNRSLNESKVRSFHEDKEQNIWIGSDGGGINIFNPKTGTYKVIKNKPNNKNSLASDNILFMMEDNKGHYWIGTWNTAISVYEPENNVFRHYDNDPNDSNSISNTHTWDILQTRNNEIWVATIGSGLNRYLPEIDGFKSYIHNKNNPNSIADDLIWDLVEDKEGNLWIATEGGLSFYNRDKDSFTNFTHDPKNKQSLSANRVLSLLTDSKDQLWVGTHGGGVNIFDNKSKTFNSIMTGEGLLSDVVHSLVEDNNGNIWLGLDKGLSSYNPSTKKIRNFTSEDGLQKNELNIGTAYKLSNGDLLFGGPEGYTRFNPNRITSNEFIPPVYITNISVLNKPVAIGNKDNILTKSILFTDKLVLNHTQNIFSLNFAALSFRNPSLNHFAYKMEGFNKDWQYVNNENKATYTNLDAGNYTFRVLASNNDGKWNDEGVALKIKVLPPLWKTWWAYTLYVVTIAAIIFGYLFMLIRANKILEHRVKERTLELEKVNEKLEVLSTTDPLTTLGNRRYLEGAVDADTQISVRRYQRFITSENKVQPKEQDITFFMIDLDFFKWINDTYGHSAGDEVLVEFSNRLKGISRDSDYIVRWGGEEFILVCRFINREDSHQIAERIIKVVKEKPFTISDEKEVQVTCSIGFASFPLNKELPAIHSWEKAVDVADMALLAVKKTERNNWLGIQSINSNQKSYKELLSSIKSGQAEIIHSYKKNSPVDWGEFKSS